MTGASAAIISVRTPRLCQLPQRPFLRTDARTLTRHWKKESEGFRLLVMPAVGSAPAGSALSKELGLPLRAPALPLFEQGL
jgi:hypothetical protein